MPQASFFLHHPDPLTREVARGYAGGAFLMDNGDGVQWYTVERRALVPLTEAEGLHVARRLRRELGRFEVRVDTAFGDVVEGCRGELPGAPERDGEWISPPLAALYTHLHGTGLAHSFEVWQGGELAGGVMGLALGGAFVAESKFHRVTNASKAALIHLAAHLHARGFTLLDAQIQNSHIARLGVCEVSGAEYRERLAEALGRDAGL
ncbi:leucyl/phenylalanyl-tRNA--protein transferase [Deinococcus metallilatus]|uniref:Leucyl/phenylalanyl-tRNA--protein transferase n=1 Tax=Deinococcus metallilatus TaxID=1211322 RepID=A0AAJ5F6K6_9DEIO|nr:leucyl/phenylalanyl-tRNA--protein transferase [Deinococcus metallilatus]MBB5296794.1 leucyl/phenylalanyl-tRNA--protein transferase [Deinococcus metallilatus]QBY09139.1 leucyl/phenylalanyl-tRNA--protein transferase [Deinococcus metallilatus]RXJ09654.1 leucyl/phenylalanyl-tRNA--protein transferase [Deinococcus metallilatus]TLK24120.1 leucyl/phenylalanyl-tRNA--protein transferase [Deinococcus metallilatus]GMA13824.1 leucyl/phenylalanyl-tRNA--protein transferase [Deinococcus metallilatus]